MGCDRWGPDGMGEDKMVKKRIAKYEMKWEGVMGKDEIEGYRIE